MDCVSTVDRQCTLLWTCLKDEQHKVLTAGHAGLCLQTKQQRTTREERELDLFRRDCEDLVVQNIPDAINLKQK